MMAEFGKRNAACLISAVSLYTAALTAASLMPVGGDSALASTATRRFINNSLHLPAYALLAWLWTAQLRAVMRNSSRGRTMFAACFAAVCFGTCMEIAQHFVPGRGAELRDFLTNSLGVGVAALLMWIRARSIAAGDVMEAAK